MKQWDRMRHKTLQLHFFESARFHKCPKETKKREVITQLRTCLHQLTEGAKQWRMLSKQTRYFLVPVQRLHMHNSPFSYNGTSTGREGPAWLHSWLSSLCKTVLRCDWKTRSQGTLVTQGTALSLMIPQQQEIWTTQAHGDAEAETKSKTSSSWEHLLVAPLQRFWLETCLLGQVRWPGQGNQMLPQNYLVDWKFVLIFHYLGNISLE